MKPLREGKEKCGAKKDTNSKRPSWVPLGSKPTKNKKNACKFNKSILL